MDKENLSLLVLCEYLNNNRLLLRTSWVFQTNTFGMIVDKASLALPDNPGPLQVRPQLRPRIFQISPARPVTWSASESCKHWPARQDGFQLIEGLKAEFSEHSKRYFGRASTIFNRRFAAPAPQAVT